MLRSVEHQAVRHARKNTFIGTGKWSTTREQRGRLTGDSAGAHPNRSSRCRYGNTRTTFSNNNRTDTRNRIDRSSNRFRASHRSCNGCGIVAARKTDPANRLGPKDHLRVNSRVRWRGRSMPRRHTPARRSEESSRAFSTSWLSAGLRVWLIYDNQPAVSMSH